MARALVADPKLLLDEPAAGLNHEEVDGLRELILDVRERFHVTPYVKAMTFGVSALYTGVAGSLGAIATAFVAPDSFGMFVSVFFLVGVVVGGLGTISGALVGAAFIQFIPNVADQISKSAPSAIFAGFLILSMFVMPQGFVGLLRSAVRRVKGWRAAR